jgi:hypothetical protein
MLKSALVSIAIAFAVVAAHADSADLKIDQFNPEPVEHAGQMFSDNIFISNLGPDTARNVVVTQKVDGFPEVQLPCPDGRCSIGDLKTTDYYPQVPRIAQALPLRDFTFTVTVTVSSDTPDPNPENNSVTRTIQVSTAPTLVVKVFLPSEQGPPTVVDPGLPFDVSLAVRNVGYDYATAHDVVATLDLPDGVGASSVPDGCNAHGQQVTCAIPTLKASFDYQPPLFKIGVTAPARYEGGTLTFHASATAREANFAGHAAEDTRSTVMYRTFFVTTTGDHGTGSLRTAVEDANALCKVAPPCTVRFNIAEPSEKPWQTIRLTTPLPMIEAASLRIDGATQVAFSHVPNPDGPAVEISGGGVVDGDGFFASCYVEIANLAINGFRRNAVSISRSPNAVCSCTICSFAGARAWIHDNYIGTDPTGSAPVPNDRGIGIAEPGILYPLSLIANNVISGNTHSAIYALGGDMEVDSNRIGLKAHADEPLPNGASGMFFGRGTGRINVRSNVIAFNAQAGVAIDPFAEYVALSANRIWGNGGLGIDDGLDGPSGFVTLPDGIGTERTPIITSAVFDPVKNLTTIHLTTDTSSYPELFVSETPGNKGSGDAQRVAGPAVSWRTVDPNATTLMFEVTFKGVQRGEWITATASRSIPHPYDGEFSLLRTTEISPAVQVQ